MGVQIESIFQLGLSFFGLTSDTAAVVRANLFTQIHEICFHGKGGFDWPTVYAMPRWLRQFTFNKINEFYQKEVEAHENASKRSGKQTLVNPDGTVNRENWKNIPQKITPGQKSKSVKYG